MSGFAQAAPAQTALLAIRNVTVVPGTGGSSMPAMTVLIRGDRIAAVGPAGLIAIPAGARVVDGFGRFLLPGLIDMHAHLSKTRGSALGLFVSNGVTTVRDMGGDYEELTRGGGGHAHRAADRDARTDPRITGQHRAHAEGSAIRAG